MFGAQSKGCLLVIMFIFFKVKSQVVSHGNFLQVHTFAAKSMSFLTVS